MEGNIMYWDTYRKNLDYGILDYLNPSLNKKPDWFKSLKQARLNEGNLNVSTCPSFVELFKKSLVYTTPCDILIQVKNRHLNITLPENMDDWFTVSTHSDYEGMDQMGSLWNADLKNFKLNATIKLRGNKEFEAIFLEPTYYNNNSILNVAPGTLTFKKDYTVQPNLNMFIDISEDSQTLIKAGEVLAMLYFPSGLPVFEEKPIKDTPKRKFIGDYIYRTKQ